MIGVYKFVGIVNLFDIYPDFLFPIYKKGNAFFFHNGGKNRIYSFDHATKSVCKKIIFLDCQDIHITNISKKEYFFVNDMPIYAFQSSEKEIICCDLGNMIKYLNKFESEDLILTKQINRFINENILQYGICEFFKAFPKKHFLNHPLLPVNRYRTGLTTKIKKNMGVIGKILKLINDMGLYMTERNLCMNLQQEVKNHYIAEVNFNKLKRDLNKDNKKLNYSIRCRNAVVNKDNNELIILIIENCHILIALQKKGTLGNHLWNYMKNHIYNYSFYDYSFGNEYDIPIEENFRKDVSVMCNLSQEIEEKGITIGRAEGETGLIIKMYKNGFTAEQIASATDKNVEEVKAIIAGEKPVLA